MGLWKGQKERTVEQYRGGYCAVPAIPGCGKTHCLSLWTVEMIAQGLHKPGKILIVTYMNSAVNNFKQRISGELHKRGIEGSKNYSVKYVRESHPVAECRDSLLPQYIEPVGEDNAGAG